MGTKTEATAAPALTGVEMVKSNWIQDTVLRHKRQALLSDRRRTIRKREKARVTPTFGLTKKNG